MFLLDDPFAELDARRAARILDAAGDDRAGPDDPRGAARQPTFRGIHRVCERCARCEAARIVAASQRGMTRARRRTQARDARRRDARRCWIERDLGARVEQASVIPEWPALVGPQIAAVTEPLSVTRGRNAVRCGHDATRG